MKKDPILRKEFYTSKKLTRKHLILVIVFLLIVLTIGISIFSFNRQYCQNRVASSLGGNSPVIDPENISPGYTLITTITPPGQIQQPGGNVYLADLYGQPVHKWTLSQTPNYAKFAKNGHLFVSIANTDLKAKYPLNALTPIIQELDWGGRVVNEFKVAGMHHDFDILPSGNIAVLIWENLTPEQVYQVQGGAPGSELEGRIYADTIAEIDKSGKVLWQWNSKDRLNFSDYRLEPQVPREEWGYANSIQYVPRDPFNNEEAYLVSFRTFNRVMLISKKTGGVIWQSPEGLLGHQHDPSLLENGNILVFDNVFYTKTKLTENGSRVIEIDPKTNEVVWEFSGGTNALEKFSFWSQILSGAQRLPNGNTLIIKGLGGELIEVTPDKKVVWDLVNPFGIKTSGPFPARSIFKARRYNPDDIEFPLKLPDPMPKLASYCQ